MSIHEWILKNQIKNEKGELVEFDTHPFLFDIYSDFSQKLTVMKAAQVGMSTCSILKNHYDAKQRKLDIIYTLPTDGDVRTFVGGKVNRIIATNPSMLLDVADKDSIEQKQVGESMIYFRGTWTAKAAIMITADRVVHDEKDSSKLSVIADFPARLQHSKYKQLHTFSHPSLPDIGVDQDWKKSDQKHWFIKCECCNEWQYLSWDTEVEERMSICFDRQIFKCKKCNKEIKKHIRQLGQWVQKYTDREWSGYWVPLLLAPWVTAKEIIEKYRDKETTKDYFFSKILGLPYADGTNKLLLPDFLNCLTGRQYASNRDAHVIMGVDTGLKLDYVLGDEHGLFHHADTDSYDELDALMLRWPKMICVMDMGGDLIGSRAFAARWKGRVFLCALTGDRNTKELITWKKGDEYGACTADRNRVIQLVVDEFRDRRILVHGEEQDWIDYYSDWNNLSKIKVIDPITNQVRGYKWVRNGRDHRAMATVFWRVGISKFGASGGIIRSQIQKANSYTINPDNTVSTDFSWLQDSKKDWRL